ncbi:MAG: hypothetical protein RJQ08_13585 [Salinisphaeraceae bacterium]
MSNALMTIQGVAPAGGALNNTGSRHAVYASTLGSPAREPTVRPTIRAIATLAAAVLAGGCCLSPTEPEIRTVTRTVEVEVPVPVPAEPPAELMSPPAIAAPVFIAPLDATATSALNPDGERTLQRLIRELLARERAWRDWASEPGQ